MIGAAKKKSLSPVSLAAVRVLLLLVITLCLPQTRVWGFGITSQPASGVFESVTPSSIGENTIGSGYDAPDSLLAARTTPKLHGNRLDAPGPHDVYVMRDAQTGRIYHFGETGRGFETRGAEWARKLQKEHGLDAIVEPLRTLEGKAAAKALESRYIRTYEKIFGIKPGYVDDVGNFVPIQKTRH